MPRHSRQNGSCGRSRRERPDANRAGALRKARRSPVNRVVWEELAGRALPVLLLDGWDRDGNAATVTVLADPEGNGPAHLDHNL